MTTSERIASDRQKTYQRRWRDKRAKIKRFIQEIDEGIAALERLPKCADCAAESARLKRSVVCHHTSARRLLNEQVEMARCQLEQLDH